MNSAIGYSEGAEVPEDKTPTDNELIARFMGGVSQKATSYSISDYPNALPPHILKDLKYHKSWDWLLPVITHAQKKIEKHGWGTPKEKEAFIRLHAARNEAANVNIKNTYYCIVKFIKWYNLESLKNKPI